MCSAGWLPIIAGLALAAAGGAAIGGALAARTRATIEAALVRRQRDVVRLAAAMVAAGNVDDAQQLLARNDFTSPS